MAKHKRVHRKVTKQLFDKFKEIEQVSGGAPKKIAKLLLLSGSTGYRMAQASTYAEYREMSKNNFARVPKAKDISMKDLTKKIDDIHRKVTELYKVWNTEPQE